MYAITATVTNSRGKWTGTHQVPTFYLDENVQGIRSEEHAKRIAADIIDPASLLDELHITAVQV